MDERKEKRKLVFIVIELVEILISDSLYWKSKSKGSLAYYVDQILEDRLRPKRQQSAVHSSHSAPLTTTTTASAASTQYLLQSVSIVNSTAELRDSLYWKSKSKGSLAYYVDQIFEDRLRPKRQQSAVHSFEKHPTLHLLTTTTTASAASTQYLLQSVSIVNSTA
uniref:Uncharacterized protein n=1 Tax=Solanum lycopersicum TaxID=4081 RepID=A0A3Q7F320_SOLLC